MRRSDAWDQHRQEVAERAALGETTKLAQQQVRATQVATARALERLTRMQSQELRPMEAMRMLVEAAKLRRDELGSLAALNAASRESARHGGDDEEERVGDERNRRAVDPERERQVLRALLEIGALDVGPAAPASSDDGDEGIPWEDA